MSRRGRRGRSTVTVTAAGRTVTVTVTEARVRAGRIPGESRRRRARRLGRVDESLASFPGH